jgi:EAL domain-containing protein (putative c-di-GMP-specific phosphodiesterase class I)
MGCDLAQGYLIGAPVSAEELRPVIELPRLIPLSVA